MGDHTEGRRVKAADTMFAIIELLQERDGAGVTEVAQELGVAKSTAHDHLHTLLHKQYVVHDDSEYRIGLKFLDHGIHARNNLKASRIVQRTLSELANETGEAAWFIVEEYGQAVFANKAMSRHSVQTHGRVGKREYMHCLAAGKAMLAHIPEERTLEIIDKYGLPQITDRTTTDVDELLAELKQIRDRGYAYNNGERVSRLKSVAAPVLDDQDHVLGSIAIPGPKHRIESTEFERDLIDALLAATNEIELRYEYPMEP
jgi:IclR family acetate operon transcriptional repressor